jgi:hypothetical protein
VWPWLECGGTTNQRLQHRKKHQKKVHFIAKTRYLGRRWKAFDLDYSLFFIFVFTFIFILDGKEFGSLGANPSLANVDFSPLLTRVEAEALQKVSVPFFGEGWSKRRSIALELTGGRWRECCATHLQCASLATRNRHRPLPGRLISFNWMDECSSLHNSTAAQHPTTLTYQLHLILAFDSTHQPRALPQDCLHERGLMITGREPMMKQQNNSLLTEQKRRGKETNHIGPEGSPFITWRAYSFLLLCWSCLSSWLHAWNMETGHLWETKISFGGS